MHLLFFITSVRLRERAAATLLLPLLPCRCRRYLSGKVPSSLLLTRASLTRANRTVFQNIENKSRFFKITKQTHIFKKIETESAFFKIK
ncbi:hypothetical protein [Methanimicrococcus blatticola]|uniref:hypothetical protein n=1 Tax=Methanimicrococcus blatticola TaxID=91560 RepID=UPI00105B4A6B|nr:hypothetical protein [Methanimicrococcus blatticola]MCC2509309.1 hypothetical protein [Methanimicrococcus blatticola]